MNQVIKVGEKAVFDCLFVSDLEVEMFWTKAVTKDNRTVYTNIPYKDIKYEGTNEHNLTINNATFEDSANYSCVVRNHFGTSFKNFTLKVISGKQRVFD